jgi:hypothetical protein
MRGMPDPALMYGAVAVMLALAWRFRHAALAAVRGTSRKG